VTLKIVNHAKPISTDEIPQTAGQDTLGLTAHQVDGKRHERTDELKRPRGDPARQSRADKPPSRYGFAAERIVLTGRNSRISSSASATNPNRS
jgi:hypothetical protein